MDIDEIRNKLREVADKQFKILKRYEKYKAKADEEERKLKALEKLSTKKLIYLNHTKTPILHTTETHIIFLF